MSIKTNIPYDKIVHTVIGFMMIWLVHLWGTIGYAFCIVIALLLKEVIWDKLMKKGAFEWLDAVYTIAFPTIALILKLLL